METSLTADEPTAQGEIAFVCVPVNLIDTVWDRCKSYLENAFSANAPAYDINDVRATLNDGGCQLWVAVGGGKILASAITMITVEPKAKTCAILHLGGQDTKLWIDALDKTLTKFAEDNGCQYVEAITRRGFSRFVPSFVEDGRVFIKRVGTVQ